MASRMLWPYQETPGRIRRLRALKRHPAPSSLRQAARLILLPRIMSLKVVSEPIDRVISPGPPGERVRARGQGVKR
jgi:hypothetical protein